MQTNPDPRPGRWILPLVILGMVGFTYFVVNSIEPAETAEDLTTTTPAAAADDDTTSTTMDAAMQAYLQGLAESQAESQSILDEAEAVNTRWENDEADFQTTLEAFQALRDRAEVFANSVETRVPPAGSEELATAHAQVIAAADRVLGAADALIAGLRAPDQGQQRRAALEALREANNAFQAAADAARAIAGGTPAPTGTTLPSETTTTTAGTDA